MRSLSASHLTTILAVAASYKLLAILWKRWTGRARNGPVRKRVVLTGHFQSGKSTAIGHLINMLGGVETGEVEIYEQQLAAMGRPTSDKYAWVLDRLPAERERGMTLAASSFEIETARGRLTFINAPGHRDFIHYMISGISQADCAVLFIDSTTGGFEAGSGISLGGQLREYSLLAFTLGVKQIICCCNKMDATGYSISRYNEVVVEVSSYLERVGYEKISFVPISGVEGDNLILKSENLLWHTGHTLLEALEMIPEPKRPSYKPLRFLLQNAYRIGTRTMAVGRVETGVMKLGMGLTFGPTGLTTRVLSIERDHEALQEAHPGDNVWVEVSNEIRARDLKRGFIASNSHDPAKNATSFIAQVIILNQHDEICNGYTAVMDCHTSRMTVTFDEILSKIDKLSGKELERWPEFLKEGEAGFVRMIPMGPVVVETFSQYPPLGYFTLIGRRGNMKIFALGVIKSVEN